jgi:hypothetical protein
MKFLRDERYSDSNFLRETSTYYSDIIKSGFYIQIRLAVAAHIA